MANVYSATDSPKFCHIFSVCARFDVLLRFVISISDRNVESLAIVKNESVFRRAVAAVAVSKQNIEERRYFASYVT